MDRRDRSRTGSSQTGDHSPAFPGGVSSAIHQRRVFSCIFIALSVTPSREEGRRTWIGRGGRVSSELCVGHSLRGILSSGIECPGGCSVSRLCHAFRLLERL